MKKLFVSVALSACLSASSANASIGFVNCATPQSWAEHVIGKLGGVFSFGLSVEGEAKTKFGVSGHADPTDGVGFAIDTPFGRVNARVNPVGALVAVGAVICLGDTTAEQ